MSDYDYDHKLRRLEELEGEHPELITPDSVSYTHLDVYKRQVLDTVFSTVPPPELPLFSSSSSSLTFLPSFFRSSDTSLRSGFLS